MKKKFTANWQDKDIPVVIETGDSSVLRVDVDGTALELDVVCTAPNRYSVLKDGQVFDVIFSGQGDSVTATVAGKTVNFTLEDEKTRRRLDHGGHQGHAGGKITSPMPGKVVKVLVKAGQAVKNGDGLVVVEAMKMENEFKAHADGVIKAVHVKAGDTVEGGQMLLEM